MTSVKALQLFSGLTGEDRSVVDVLVEYAAPRYLSLALDGYSLLLLDFVHASTVVLNSSDMGPSVSFFVFNLVVCCQVERI